MANLFAELCIRWRVSIMAAIVAVTVILGCFALRLDVRTIFTDLQPSNHPYINI